MAVQFSKVVAGREQQPFPAGLIEPAQQQMFGVLQGRHLTEDRFDDGLAAGINGLSAFGLTFPRDRGGISYKE